MSFIEKETKYNWQTLTCLTTLTGQSNKNKVVILLYTNSLHYKQFTETDVQSPTFQFSIVVKDLIGWLYLDF